MATVEQLQALNKTLTYQIKYSNALASSLVATQGSIDTLWVTVATVLIFFMQTGFALLEAGTVRSKNTQNILLKNMMDTVICTFTWWFFGYAIAFGDTDDQFIGTNKYFGVSLGTAAHYRDWFFQWSFSTTASTIVSGALAERTKLIGYAIFAFWFSIIVYPFIVHWVWGGGWLGRWGYTDFAGSGVIHLCGGVASLVAAFMVGPRIGRFENLKTGEKKAPDSEWRPSSVPLQVTGTFILWFGWYGFNCGSTLGITGDNTKLVSKVGLTTTVGASAGGFGGLVMDWIFQYLESPNTFEFGKLQWNVTPALTNGVLAGLVAVTAGCANISPWAAFVIGFLGGILVMLSSYFVSEILKVDDPLDAFSVHGMNGIWGVIALGFFHNDIGVFYGKNSGSLLLKQFVGILAVIGWTATWCFLVFFLLKVFGKLRVAPKVEKMGLDKYEHGGEAYNIKSKPSSPRKHNNNKNNDQNIQDQIIYNNTDDNENNNGINIEITKVNEEETGARESQEGDEAQNEEYNTEHSRNLSEIITYVYDNEDIHENQQTNGEGTNEINENNDTNTEE